MSLATPSVAAPFTTDEQGVVRIGGSRVMLEWIVHAFEARASAEEIVASYPTLELGDVYARIAFILKNRPQVEAYIVESETEAERLHREGEVRHPTSELRRRIRERAGRL